MASIKQWHVRVGVVQELGLDLEGEMRALTVIQVLPAWVVVGEVQEEELTVSLKCSLMEYEMNPLWALTRAVLHNIRGYNTSGHGLHLPLQLCSSSALRAPAVVRSPADVGVPLMHMMS